MVELCFIQLSVDDFTLYGGVFGNKQDSVFQNLEVCWCLFHLSLLMIFITSYVFVMLFQTKSLVLVSSNIRKQLSGFVDVWLWHVHRRLCCPPPLYGCRRYHRLPLLWFLHCSRIRLMQLLSTWTQTRLLSSASMHLLLPCWSSASLTAAGNHISLTLAGVQNEINTVHWLQILLNSIWTNALCNWILF